jgi:3-methyl-2-oxobutanoate hydroxymethyltransferase
MTDGGISPYGSPRNSTVRRIRTHHLQSMKDRGERWAMLTAYDMHSASIFDEVGIPALLVGDSAANNVFGFDTTLPITVDELLPLVRAVVRSTRSALVVADLPFGSYQVSPEQALQTAIRFMKEGGAQAVKLEGGRAVLAQVRAIVDAGVPVMAHIGFTPQTTPTVVGYRVQGRTAAAARSLVEDARALEEAGAFSIVLEMTASETAKAITGSVDVPTIGIGAGRDCDGQILVLHDILGLFDRFTPKFAKRYLDLSAEIQGAIESYAEEVASGVFPDEEHTFHMDPEEANKLSRGRKTG